MSLFWLYNINILKRLEGRRTLNYITEILAFNDLLLSQPLSTGQIALWYALMYVNNKCGWAEWFSAPNRTLEFYTGLSRQGINKARNSLKQLGLIDFRSGGTKAATYKLTPMSKSVQDSIQEEYKTSLSATLNSLQDGVQSSIQNGIQDGVQSSIQNGIQDGVQESAQYGSALNKQNININKNKQNKTAKKESKKKEASYDDILSEFVYDERLREAYLEFIKMRRLSKKPMTNKALETLIRKVDSLEPESVKRKIERRAV